MPDPAFVAPEHLHRANIGAFGPDAAAWLEDLSSILQACAERWSLTLGSPFANSSYNFVVPALLQDGGQAVLKLGFPRPELTREMRALRFANGQGLVQLLRGDEAIGAMLLARVWPGTTLAALEDDEEATAIAAEVIRRIWRPLPIDHGFRPVQEWADGLARLRSRFRGGTGPLPAQLVEIAERLFTDLFASVGETGLLHGDLHHDNILGSGDDWIAIDPKGMAGEAIYDVGALLWNPIGIHSHTDLDQIQSRRVAILSERLDADPKRIAAWGVAQAMLSAWWCVEEDGQDWRPAVRIAESLCALI